MYSSRHVDFQLPVEIKRGDAFLATGPFQYRTNSWGRGCYPFRRSRARLDEADDTGTPPLVNNGNVIESDLKVRDED